MQSVGLIVVIDCLIGAAESAGDEACRTDPKSSFPEATLGVDDLKKFEESDMEMGGRPAISLCSDDVSMDSKIELGVSLEAGGAFGACDIDRPSAIWLLQDGVAARPISSDGSGMLDDNDVTGLLTETASTTDVLPVPDFKSNGHIPSAL
jgi:hypothetical protein